MKKPKPAPPQVGHFYHWAHPTRRDEPGFFVDSVRQRPKIPGRRGRRAINVYLYPADIGCTYFEHCLLTQWGRGMWAVHEVFPKPVWPLKDALDRWLFGGNLKREQDERSSRYYAPPPTNDSLDNYVAFFGSEGKQLFYQLELVARDPQITRAWGARDYVDAVCARVPPGMGAEFFERERAAREAKK